MSDKRKFEDEVLETLEGLPPNLVERAVRDAGYAAELAVIAATLTASMGWWKWPIRAAAAGGGVALGEVHTHLQNYFTKRQLARALSQYNQISSDQGAESAERFLQGNCKAMVDEVREEVVKTKNELNGRQAEIAELNKELKAAEKAAKILSDVEWKAVEADAVIKAAQNDVEFAKKRAEEELSKISKKTEKEADGILSKFAETIKNTAKGIGRPMKNQPTEDSTGTDNS